MRPKEVGSGRENRSVGFSQLRTRLASKGDGGKFGDGGGEGGREEQEFLNDGEGFLGLDRPMNPFWRTTNKGKKQRSASNSACFDGSRDKQRRVRVKLTKMTEL